MRKSFHIPHIRNSGLLTVLLQLVVCANGTANAQTTLPPNECESTQGSCYTNTALNNNPALVATFVPASGTVSAVASVAYAPGSPPSPYIGARTSPGNAPGAIDVWGMCRYVNNLNPAGGYSYFIPFRSQNEWQAFYTNAPGNNQNNILLLHCARPASFLISRGDPSCSPAAITVSLPYDPVSTILTYNGSFSCTSPYGPWTETVSVQYTALDSDASNPSWAGTSPVYTGHPPPPPVVVSGGGGGGGGGGGCFVTGSLVLMANGHLRPIESLQFGDRVRNVQGSVNMVLRREICALPKGSDLYGLNGGKPMVTSRHPFVIAEGFAAIDPENLLNKYPYFEEEIGPLTHLKAGITLLSPEGPRRVDSVQQYPVTEDDTAYDLVLDGDQTFFVEGFAVRSQHENAHALRYIPQALMDKVNVRRATAVSSVFLSLGIAMSPLAALAGGGSSPSASSSE